MNDETQLSSEFVSLTEDELRAIKDAGFALSHHPKGTLERRIEDQVQAAIEKIITARVATERERISARCHEALEARSVGEYGSGYADCAASILAVLNQRSWDDAQKGEKA